MGGALTLSNRESSVLRQLADPPWFSTSAWHERSRPECFRPLNRALTLSRLLSGSQGSLRDLGKGKRVSLATALCGLLGGHCQPWDGRKQPPPSLYLVCFVFSITVLPVSHFYASPGAQFDRGWAEARVPCLSDSGLETWKLGEPEPFQALPLSLGYSKYVLQCDEMLLNFLPKCSDDSLRVRVRLSLLLTSIWWAPRHSVGGELVS